MELRLPEELYRHETLPDGRKVSYCTMRQIVLHCIGLADSGSQRHKPYIRHGRKFYRPWRNYFCTFPDDKTWTGLCEAGYAEHGAIHQHDSGETTTFWLNRKGLDWVGEQLGMTIHDEED